MVYTGEAYSRYEIYQGSGCPGTFVACGGFSLSVTQHASIIPNVQAGDSFLVRGGFSYGFLQVTRSGNGCEGVGSDPFSGNQECATPAPIGNGTFLDLSVNRGDSDYYQVCVAAGDDLSVTLGSKILDNTYRLRLHDASVTPCDSNLSGSLIGESFSESIHYHNATSGPVDVRIAVQPVWWFWGCNRYDMTIAGANGCDGLPGVSTFCDPMDVNSTGIPTVLTATGGTGIHSGVRLEATQGSPNQFAMMLIGTGATNPGLAIGQGRLCLDTQSGNRFGRYNIHGTAMNSSGRFDANGVLQNLAGTSITGSGFDVPKWIPAINQVLRSGETWHFQLWHREPNGTSNFSNGVTVSFQTLPQ
ncbi:MAG: hypothetical protein P1V35_01135 [Planctomycetota bacterium]|nr:hypothetical protein [Planctomycetota bacterium]